MSWIVVLRTGRLSIGSNFIGTMGGARRLETIQGNQHLEVYGHSLRLAEPDAACTWSPQGYPALPPPTPPTPGAGHRWL